MKFYNLKGTMQKRKFLTLLLVFILSFSMSILLKAEYLVDAKTDDVEVSLSASVADIVDTLDLSGLQGILEKLDNSELFGMSIREKVELILSGKYFTDYSSIVSAILSLIFGNIKSLLPIIFTILAIGILCNLISSIKVSNAESSDMVYFVCYAVIVILILISFKDILSDLKGVIDGISRLMQVVFPILISLLVSIGSMSSVSIYNPLVAVLSTVVDIVFSDFLYPIFVVIFLFTVLSNLTTNIKLDKMTQFFSSLFKWAVGIVFTLFAGFLSVQGISAGKFDSLSIKATKFAVKSYIPIIGSFMADGMDFIVLGSVLVKNTIGLVAILLLFLMIIIPVVKVVTYKLLLQLTSGVLELSGSSKIASFIHDVSKVLILPIVIVLGVAFMFILTVALIMCTANIF
ncbi:MAG: hypothetical protein E7354_01370 [Clostridiales bacterium]|nr:hypothetical protein [Clostridiales bacterium]